MKIIDEDIERRKPVSDAYREGWERVFGEKKDEPAPVENSDTIECRIGYYANVVRPPVAVIPLGEDPASSDDWYVDGEPKTDGEALITLSEQMFGKTEK